MGTTLETRLCPYKSGDGLYGYQILNTYTSDFSHVLICRGPTGQLVVLKTPVDASDYDYFRKEVRWWQALTATSEHAVHLVRCTAFVRLEMKPFAVLEYVNGPDLRTLLSRSPDRRIATSQAMLFAMQFCRGMIAAGEQATSYERRAMGFAHRDICPDNIMVSCLTEADAGGNTLKIADFGLARALMHASTRGHKVARFTGRPDYAAPEALEGNHRTSVASDVYSFGVTLWEVLTGSVPHRIRTNEALDVFRWRLLRQEPPQLLDHRPDTPEQLGLILATCLRHHASARYADFEALLDDLRALAVEAIGTGMVPDEDVQCGACSYIPPKRPADDLCALCGRDWEPVPIGLPLL